MMSSPFQSPFPSHRRRHRPVPVITPHFESSGDGLEDDEKELGFEIYSDAPEDDNVSGEHDRDSSCSTDDEDTDVDSGRNKPTTDRKNTTKNYTSKINNSIGNINIDEPSFPPTLFTNAYAPWDSSYNLASIKATGYLDSAPTAPIKKTMKFELDHQLQRAIDEVLDTGWHPAEQWIDLGFEEGMGRSGELWDEREPPMPPPPSSSPVVSVVSLEDGRKRKGDDGQEVREAKKMRRNVDEEAAFDMMAHPNGVDTDQRQCVQQ